LKKTKNPSPSLEQRLLQWRNDPMEFYRTQVILENGKPLGDQWDDWQRDDLIGVTGHQNSLLLRPRGHDKTGTAGSVILHALVCGGQGLRAYSVASDQQQANLLLDDVIAKARRNPLLARAIRTTKTSVTVVASDNRYETLASDAPSAFGLRPDMLVADELAEWPSRADGLWVALWSATGKRPHTKTLVISSPGGQLLSSIREMARTEENWFTSERQQCASWISPTWLAQQRKSLPLHVYRRLHEGIWVESEGMFLSREEVDRIFQSYEGQVIAYAIGCELGVTRDRAVLSVCGLTAEGVIVVERLYVYTPTRAARVDLTEVEETCTDLAKRLNATVVADPWQAVGMIQRMQTQDINVIEYPFTSDNRKKLFARLLDMIRTDRLRAERHELLEKELLGLQVEQQGAGWRVDHKPHQHDDCVIAIGLALMALCEVIVYDNKPGLREILGVPEGGVFTGAEVFDNFLKNW